MADVFISYASDDRPRIEPLARALEAAGYSLWWDRNILAGSDFSREIERELDASRAVVVAWSTAAAASKWVRDEASAAREQGKLIPIVLEASVQPLGFRQLHALEFGGWNGGREAAEFRALDAALRRLIDQPSQPGAAPSAAPSGATTPPPRTLVTLGAAVAVVLAVALFAYSVVRRSEPPASPSARDMTVEDQAGAPKVDAKARALAPTADERFEAAARQAIEAISQSPRSEDRAAYQSFIAGDARHALEILEQLGADLEAAGDIDGAAAALTRAGAVGLLVDPGRGLAARRKAFSLKPDSLTTFLGLFFDITLLQGYKAAMQLVADTKARPGLSNRMRSWAEAHAALLDIDIEDDLPAAERRFSEVERLAGGSDDPVLQAIRYWTESVISLFRDDIARSIQAVEAAEKLLPQLPQDFPRNFDVMSVRAKFAAGDWNGAFAEGSVSLDRRRATAAFIPYPLVASVCEAGLYLGRVQEAAAYCGALADQITRSGEFNRKFWAAMLAAGLGDFRKAEIELEAAAALATPAGDKGDSHVPYARAYLEGRRGRIAEAAAAMDDYVESSLGAANLQLGPRSRKATALRLLGVLALESGAAAQACGPLRRAYDLYVEIGGAAGAAATDSTRRRAGCAD